MAGRRSKGDDAIYFEHDGPCIDIEHGGSVVQAAGEDEYPAAFLSATNALPALDFSRSSSTVLATHGQVAAHVRPDLEVRVAGR